ncbi:MAG: hypothetical protein M1837_007094 [Sclerophora amabilis]|nr:MAG: hypothetical protein M1837_007094 [Sclerophora amabilis]
MAAAGAAAATANALTAATRQPRIGSKQIFLPNITLTLLRTPFLPPTYASFIVPLTFNKLDIKDYLYHAYSVRVLSVRSYVQQQQVRQDKAREKVPKPRRWFRPRSIKKMTVEMESPFVWPPEPEDYSPWDKKTFEALEKAQENERDAKKPYRKQSTPGRGSIAAQAQRLLKGEERWKPEWEDVGEPLEVEKDVPLTR